MSKLLMFYLLFKYIKLSVSEIQWSKVNLVNNVTQSPDIAMKIDDGKVIVASQLALNNVTLNQTNSESLSKQHRKSHEVGHAFFDDDDDDDEYDVDYDEDYDDNNKEVVEEVVEVDDAERVEEDAPPDEPVDYEDAETKPPIILRTKVKKKRKRGKKHGSIKVKDFKKLRKFMLPLLLAYKLKFFTLVPLLLGGLVLIVATTGFAGFFFALFAVGLGLKHHHR